VQQTVGLSCSRDIVGGSPAALTAQGDVAVWRWRDLARVALDRARARRAAERRSVAVVADEEQGLSGVVRVRTWLAHELSSYFDTALTGWRRIGGRLTAIR
jgi:hypothetical protein